jgi:rhamnulokinase
VTKKALVAVDLGGESCRVSLLRWVQGNPSLQLIHRFSNGPFADGRHLYWDIGRVYDGVEKGIRLCADVASEGIAAIGVDGWGVDYVRMKPDGQPLNNPFCYRDERTVAAEEQVHKIISREKLYSLTGIQFLRINTLYQLYADRADGIDESLPWLQVPEYITHRLGGEPVSEYTNVTHSALVSLDTRDWCREIFDAVGLDMNAAHRIVPPGSVVGRLRPALATLPALSETQLIIPACHDTASAIAGIPADGDDWAFISSGTWSLIGTLLDSPCGTREAREKNFTNLGGAGKKICFLRNVNGMWLLTQCVHQWNSQGYDVPLDELIEACAELPAPKYLLDVDDPELLLPGNLPAVINSHRLRAGREPLSNGREGIVRMANLVIHSLAARYAKILAEMVEITRKKIRRVYIVGGGARNDLLNRLTGELTGFEIVVGSPESSTMGNFAIQLASLAGDYTPSTGVNYAAVVNWAGELIANSSHISVLSGSSGL